MPASAFMEKSETETDLKLSQSYTLSTTYFTGGEKRRGKLYKTLWVFIGVGKK